jgi:MarR family transcriptional regulator, organic hydroperoxide resistance regulator
MAVSTKNRELLHPELVSQIRHFIAGTILFNQKVAESVGLHLTDMQCMNVLELLGPSTPRILAERTGLTTGGVTVMLDRLEKGGYVKREPNPNDRRSILVRVNPRKLQKINAIYDGINRQLEAFLSTTSQEEIQAVTKFLASMNAIRTGQPSP